MVVNNALNRVKKRRHEKPYADIELAAGQLTEVESSYQGLSAQEQTQYIGLAMERLRPEDRLVLTLYYLNEQSLGEIADITGIPKANVKMQLHRARGRMFGVLSVLLNRKINTL